MPTIWLLKRIAPSRVIFYIFTLCLVGDALDFNRKSWQVYKCKLLTAEETPMRKPRVKRAKNSKALTKDITIRRRLPLLFSAGLVLGVILFYGHKVSPQQPVEAKAPSWEITFSKNTSQPKEGFAIELARSDNPQTLKDIVKQISSSLDYPHIMESATFNQKTLYRLTLVGIPTLSQAWKTKNKLSPYNLNSRIYRIPIHTHHS